MLVFICINDVTIDDLKILFKNCTMYLRLFTSVLYTKVIIAEMYIDLFLMGGLSTTLEK